MHIVTKILVVIAAVLSILLAALTIAYSTDADRITRQFTEMRAEANSAMTTLQEERTNHTVQVQSLEGQVDQLSQQIEGIQREKESLLRDNGRLLAQVKTAETEAMTVQSRIDQLSATAQMQARLIDSMYDEVDKLRDNELDYAQQEIQLTERINDLSGQLEVAVETNRALQERIVELQGQLADASGRTGQGRQQDRTAASRRGPFQARVTSVARDPASGRLLAEIDAGSSDRVQTGQQLMIVRDGEFVANLEVRSVDLNESTGEVNTLGRDVEIRAGDRVFEISR